MRFVFRISIAILIVCIGCLLGYWKMMISKIPMSQVDIPVISMEKKLDIPPRPGVQGIVITGAIIQDLYFEIDQDKSDIIPLNWENLKIKDPNTDIKITYRINESGRLIFKEIQDVGHGDAGNMIRKAMDTWLYKPYKTGTIRFWFHLQSKGTKVWIDVSELERKPDIPAEVQVYNGQVYYINDINSKDIRLGGNF